MQRREIEYTVSEIGQLDLAVEWVKRFVYRGIDCGPVVVRIGRERRNLEQNAMLWAMLSDVSAQHQWYGQTLSAEDWKNIFSAAVLNQRTVPGIDGGIVVLGQSTSKMTKGQFSEMIEYISAWGADNGIRWTDRCQ